MFTYMTEQTIADQLGEDVLNQISSEQNAANPINRIKDRIDDNDTTRGFSISRIPTEAHEDFKLLSGKMFGDDYGMTLAFLIHYFKMNEKYNERVEDMFDDVMHRLDDLEEKIEENDTETGSKEVSTVNE